MTREEAKHRLLNIQRCTPIHTREDVRDFESLEMAIKALEQEPSGDLISRQAVLDGIDRYIYKSQSTGTQDDFYSFAELVVKALPSVNPQESKTGHWIKSNIPNEKYVCSECGGGCWYYDYQADVAKSRYCPNCGCRMVEPQETETWNGYHGQITAPKGTFEKIYEDAESEDKE